MDTIHNYLIESIKQNNDMYKNTLNATHPNPCGICKKNVIKIKRLSCAQTVVTGYILNVMAHL